MPVVLCYPYAYKHVIDYYDEGITYSNFPNCAWAGDAFSAWWALNKNSIDASNLSAMLNGITNATFGAINLASTVSPFGLLNLAGVQGNSFEGTVGGFSNLTNSAQGVIRPLVSAYTQVQQNVAKVQDAKNAPNQMFGQTRVESLNTGLGRARFTFNSVCIKRDYAKIVDDFFTRFGYACKRNKVPNRNARPHWTYVKTIGCTLKGSLPSDSASNICEIYNTGITFWNDGDEIGDYSLDNSPITP